METVKAPLVKTALVAGLVMLFSGNLVRAHHSIALQFDMTTEIVVVGNILEMAGYLAISKHRRLEYSRSFLKLGGAGWTGCCSW